MESFNHQAQWQHWQRMYMLPKAPAAPAGCRLKAPTSSSLPREGPLMLLATLRTSSLLGSKRMGNRELLQRLRAPMGNLRALSSMVRPQRA